MPLMSMPRMACGLLARLLGRLGQLDAAGLAAPADQHLRLDDDHLADAPGDGLGLVRRVGHFPGVHRDAVPRQDLFGLVFVYIH